MDVLIVLFWLYYIPYSRILSASNPLAPSFPKHHHNSNPHRAGPNRWLPTCYFEVPRCFPSSNVIRYPTNTNNRWLTSPIFHIVQPLLFIYVKVYSHVQYYIWKIMVNNKNKLLLFFVLQFAVYIFFLHFSYTNQLYILTNCVVRGTSLFLSSYYHSSKTP